MKTETKQKIVHIFLILSIVAYTVKNLFVGMDVDEGYGVMVGYRLAMGDRLMLEMWEPHQTSAIFTALFAKPFLAVMGGKADFLDLYLKAAYFAIHILITLFIYKTLNKCISDMDKSASFVTALIFYVTSPKSIFIPEYSNLHVWFFTLLIMMLLRYYSDTGIRYLICAGFAFTCDVLAYPGMVLLLPFIIFFIIKKRRGGVLKELAAFISPCVISFALFMAYILSYMPMELVFEVIPYITSEGSHRTDSFEKLTVLLKGFGEIGFLTAGSALFAYIIVKIFFIKKNPGTKDKFTMYILTWFVLQSVIQIIGVFTSSYGANYPQIAYITIGIMGIILYFAGESEEKNGLYIILFSAVSYIAVLLMSNWGPMNLNTYMFGGVIGGMLCLNSFLRKSHGKKGAAAYCYVCMSMIIVNVFSYCFLIIGGEDSHSQIYTVGGIGKGGVKAGIFGSWMSSFRYNSNLEIWPEAVPDKSKVLYVGQSQFFYMLGDCVVASPNTISTPVYDESLLRYWEINPDRYPDVVVFESWFGDIRHYDEDSFIVQWVENEFRPARVEEYPYITVYYKK